MIERAVEAGLEPLSFLLGERWLDQLSPLFEKLADYSRGNIPVFIGEIDLLEQLTGFSVTRGALAAFRRPSVGRCA